MKFKLAPLALVATLALAAAAPALAESTYGYSAAGTGTVTATARVTLAVTVPKLILLRVGTAAATVDTLNWAVAHSIPGTPTTPVATANNVGVNWSGVAPTITATPATNAAVASAWTNATAGTINCAATAIGAGGPTLANFTVAAGAGTLAHPGANLGACASTTFASNAVQTSTWTYTLGGTPATWGAGAYTTTVTYTASGV